MSLLISEFYFHDRRQLHRKLNLKIHFQRT